MVLIVVEVVLYYHFSGFCDKNWQLFIKKEAYSPTLLYKLQPIMATSCAPTMQKNRSGGLGTAFRQPRNGRKVLPGEQETALFRPACLAETTEIVVEVVI